MKMFIKFKNINIKKSKKSEKSLMRKSNIKNYNKVFNQIDFNFKNFEFFNVVCSNVFKNFLSVGSQTKQNLDLFMRNHLENFEYIIISFLFKFENGELTITEIFRFLEENSILKNLFYFFILLKNLSWEQFYQFTIKLETIADDNIGIKLKKKKINITLITLDSLKKILYLKNLIKSYYNGFISEGHFKLAIKKYKLNKNLSMVLVDNSISEYINSYINIKKDLNFNGFSFNSGTIGFYDTIINKYLKFSLFTQSGSKDDLSLILKKHRWTKLNSRKNTGKLSYIHALALAYIGDPLILPFAPKAINLRYRAYRIFLYTFKLKPFKLWQLTRKSRDYKYGGLLIDHLSKYELNIQNILLMANFCLNIPEVKDYLRKGHICINNKIILTHNYTVKPFDIVHFNENIFRQERDRFLLNMTSAFIKNVFSREFSQLFEYNFKVFCFIMLPNFFKYRKLSLAPYYTIYNSGRFRIEKF